MLNLIANAFMPSRGPYIAPSALLTVGTFGRFIEFFHLVPENGNIERFGSSATSSIPLRRKGFIEQGREQIGTVTCYVGDGETANSFLRDIENRVRKLWNDFISANEAHGQATSIEIDYLVQNLLQPAVLGAIHEREGRDRSMNATQTYPIYVLRIMRSRAGAVLYEPTSFS